MAKRGANMRAAAAVAVFCCCLVGDAAAGPVVAKIREF